MKSKKKISHESKSNIRKVIFNPPATIVLWGDGTKTVVRCHRDDTYDKQTGFLLCIAKRFFKGRHNSVSNHHCPEPETGTQTNRPFVFDKGALKDVICRLSDDNLVSTYDRLNHWKLPNYLADVMDLPVCVYKTFTELPKAASSRIISPVIQLVKDEIANREYSRFIDALNIRTEPYTGYAAETTWETFNEYQNMGRYIHNTL